MKISATHQKALKSWSGNLDNSLVGGHRVPDSESFMKLLELVRGAGGHAGDQPFGSHYKVTKMIWRLAEAGRD